ncbi:HD-GYP domain-containing protein [Thermohalobacter berrensis]|uniref:Phosphohydrolase n=1 Tax=Thermohalobacter berrensis TaxID=99594 RepID=A0A419TAA8_9FIRM|nr:HD domain-containing phosphohydrolase [Thermohalobacter berrensis]RKD34387.1 phosphohydrolase [Thermohalobacter berrensis]
MYNFKIKNNISYEIMLCLVASLEAKDRYTSGHSKRVAQMTYELCKSIGLKEYEIEQVYIAAKLHDIGKISVPNSILNKKTPLDKKEWEKIMEHPAIGYSILSQSNNLKNVAKIVLHHHEWWDGKGYPHKIKGEDIPISSRIISICDSIDAMLSERPYRKRLTFKECLNEIHNNKGTQFDPYLVDKVEMLWPKFKNLFRES